jgi:hypothetical protein
MSDRGLEDRLAIEALVDNWAVWRDAGDWERFRSVWHDDGRMDFLIAAGVKPGKE